MSPSSSVAFPPMLCADRDQRGCRRNGSAQLAPQPDCTGDEWAPPPLWSYCRSCQLPRGESLLGLLPFISLVLASLFPHGCPLFFGFVFMRNRSFHKHKLALVCVWWDFGSGGRVASSQLASKGFRARSDRTAGWWLVYCFPTLRHLLSGSHPSYLPSPSVFLRCIFHHLFSPFVLTLSMSSSSSPPVCSPSRKTCWCALRMDTSTCCTGTGWAATDARPSALLQSPSR